MPFSAQSNELAQHIMPETTLADERTRALFGSIPVSLTTSIALDLILSASQWNVIAHNELMLWNSLMFCAILLRTACWFFWRNNTYKLASVHWLNVFRCGVWISGAAWGCSAFFMFANFNPTYQALLAFTLAGVSSGSLTTLAVDRQSALGFVALAVLPLTLRLFMEHGPIAIPMGIMSVLYIIFVLSASTRARNNLEDQHNKNTRLLAWGKERIKQQKLSKTIGHAQAQFIKDTDIQNIFSHLLMDTLELTESKFGLIGEVFYNNENKPELKILAIGYDEQDTAPKIFQNNDEYKNITFNDMNNLFGTVILKGKAVISNNPSKDMRAGDLPDGYPQLSAFIGIPIFNGTTQMAILSLINKPNGYDESSLEFLKPAANTIAQIIEAVKHSHQQKLYEDKLHNSAKHTQAILDEVFDAIITADNIGVIKSFNHAAETIFGYSADEIIGTNINQLIPEPINSPQHDNSKKPGMALSYIVNANQELTGLRRNGKEFPIDFAISEIVINNESIYIGVVRDISDRRRNEELKNQFISTVSHELRTPLTSIAGALGILNSGSLGSNTPQQQKLISIALNNSTRLQSLINDLLDMDKLLANKMELYITPLCILEQVCKSIESNQLFASKYNVTLKLMSTPKSTLVYGDAQKIQQVLANLFSNAAKFSYANSTVDVGISIMGRFARVTITDHGDGVPEGFKTKIFQRFSQADSSDTRQKGGSGLGLAISKELVQRMSGNIGFTSTLGKGSCFYFELPLVNQSFVN